MSDHEQMSVSRSIPDLVSEQVAALQRLFPECVAEGRVDFERLRATLGEADALAATDGYTFSWAGKAEAFRAIQTPSAASLAPDPAASVNWDTTGHLFIAGENLETLKLLYKAYYGRVKMIYIDPPYNTGNDFIYQDDYSQPRRAYLEKTGQMDAEGNLLRSNPEAGGRYHSDWLNMIYPRLFLARQLLREDGVIFVSIDDHEVHHLRLVMNEIFGEENFVATIIWQKVFAPKNTARYFSDDHDYVLVYARSKASFQPNLLPRTDEADARYTNPDNDPRGAWASSDLTARNYYGEGRYEVTSRGGRTFRPSIGTYWRVSKENFQALDADRRVWWGEDGNNMPRLKRFLADVKIGIVPQTLWLYGQVGHTQEAKRDLLHLVHFDETENVLNTLKPVRLLRRMLVIGTDPAEDDIVLDFFAGSSVTAQAVLEQNREDGGNRRFVMVQYPEALPVPEPRLETIADIGLERIRRVIARMEEGDTEDSGGQLAMPLEERETPEDLGVRVFRLAPSTYRQWQPPEDEGDAEALARQFEMFDNGLEAGADPLHVLYETLLKEGYDLVAPIEELTLAGSCVYRIGPFDDTRPAFYLCLEDALSDEVLDALPLNPETTFICLDTALDDSQKVNLSLRCNLKVI